MHQKDNYNFEGSLYEDPEFMISHTENTKMDFDVDKQKVTLDLGYKISSEEQANLAFLVPLQLKFIKDKIGFYLVKFLFLIGQEIETDLLEVMI